MSRERRTPVFAGSVALLAIALAACSSAASNAPTQTAVANEATPTAVASEATPTEAANKQIIWVSGLANLPFYTTLGCGAAAKAAELGYNLDIQAPAQWDVTLQRPILDAAIARNPAAIMITPNDPVALEAPLKQAKEAGIAIVVVDTSVGDASIPVSTVTSDNTKIGETGFEAMKQAKPDGGKVLVVRNAPAIQPERDGGFMDALKADPKFELIGPEYEGGDPTKAAQIVAAALARDPDIVGVWIGGSIEGAGVITGVKQAGRLGDVAIVEGDADAGQIEALKAGEIAALSAQQPYKMGEMAVEQVDLALTGGTPEKSVFIDPGVITAANVDSPDVQGFIYKDTCN